ncbi:uncharacterized protein [Scyliorhinus torazame]|uniref:uncharacterized protein n=1 Tax=Scyliorhinus torazame TaxID=75743 RepID=UPI003B5B8A0E
MECSPHRTNLPNTSWFQSDIDLDGPTSSESASTSKQPSSEMENIQPPPQFHISGNLGANWKIFKQKFLLYIEASDLKATWDVRKIALFLSTAGDHAIHIYNSLTFADGEDKTKFKTVLLKFDSHCDIEVNESYERYIFQQRLQGKGEPFQSFLTHLRILAQSCNYDSTADSMIRDQIVFADRSDSLRQQLLKIKQLTLSFAIETCAVHEHAKNRYSHIRAAETAKLDSHEAERVQAIAQMQGLSIEESGGFARLSRIPAHARHDRVDDETENPTAQVRTSADRTAHARWRTDRADVSVMTCLNCGSAHLKRQCPARGRRCLQCGKLGHYAAFCRSAPLLSNQRSQLRHRSIHSIQGMPNSDPDSPTDPDADCPQSPYRMGIITTHELASTTPAQRLLILSVDPDDKWCAALTVNKPRIRFKLDPSASANLISQSDLDTIRARPSILPPICQRSCRPTRPPQWQRSHLSMCRRLLIHL